MNTHTFLIGIKRSGLERLLLTMTMIIFGMFSVFSQKDTKLNQALEQISEKGSTSRHIEFKQGLSLKAVNLFTTHKSAFGLSDNDQMVNIHSLADHLGYTHYRFMQYHKGIPLETAVVIIAEKDGEAKSLTGDYLGKLNLPKDPQISESYALQKALDHMGSSVYAWQLPSMENFIKQRDEDPNATFYPKGLLCYYRMNESFKNEDIRLAYKFSIYSVSPINDLLIYVDAMTGEILGDINQICNADEHGDALTRYSGFKSIKTTHHYFPLLWDYYSLKETGRGGGIETLDMNNDSVHGRAVEFKDENNLWYSFSPEYDQVALDAHWGAEVTYDYFLDVHTRNSYNNAGGKISSYIHFKSNYNNAYWSNSLKVMTYGDGDGAEFTPLTCLDVVGHEITHGVISSVPCLNYRSESGALNEAFADIFGTAVEGYGKSLNWTLADEIMPNGPLRNIKSPKACGQPDTYGGTNWEPTSNPNKDNDWGGVHTNSGVANYWFYLLVNGGTGTNDEVDGNRDKYNVKGIGFEKAIEIAYLTLTTKLGPNSTFMDARDGSIAVTKAKYPGDCTDELVAVTNAWYAVNVGDPVIQLDSFNIEKASCDSANGKLWVQVIGVTAPGIPEYEWSNGEDTQGIEDLLPETYSVTITDPTNKCKVDTNFVLEEDINFTMSISKTDVTVCKGKDGTATIAVNNANGTPEIEWSNGESSNTINELEKGWYYVTVTDTATNCDRTDSIELKEPEIDVRVSGGGTRTVCNDDPAPTFTLSASASNCNDCEYTWSTGETSQSITVNSSGYYSCTAKNPEGCSGSEADFVLIVYKDCDDPDDPEWEVPIVYPIDPNEIIGPPGYGPERYVAKSASQAYTILFENDPDFATAPAIKVTVDAPFDPKTDMYSLRLGDFGFGDFVFSVPPNTSFYTTRLDLVDSLGVFVDITAGIDVNSNKGFWILQSIDPATGVEVTDPNLGFLLVNDSVTHKGEGFVSFTHKAKSNTLTGDTLQAIGYIVFDQNEAIVTNTWKNILDAIPPSSQVEPLPAETDSSRISIDVSGTDDPGGSGLKHFILYYSENEGLFQVLGEYTASDTIIFTGTPGKSYSFFSIARDNVGNVEAMKTMAETAIHFNQYTPVITGQLTYANALSTPLNNTVLTLKNSLGAIVDTSRTNAAGTYSLRPFAPGTFAISAAITKPWGGVNATDALLALKHFAEITPLTGNHLIAADVNATGLVNAIDALLIARRFTMMITGFTAGNWYYTRDSVEFIDSVVNNNIKAICYGDADGSYIPLNTKQDPTVRLYPENTMTVNPGQEFEVPVGIDKSQIIGAMSLVLNFPSDLVDITGVRANSAKEGNMVYAVYGNELRVAWYSLEPVRIENEGTVLFLKFKAKNLASTMIAVLSLGPDCSIADASAREISQVNLYVPKIKIDIPLDFFILGNRPNPFNTSTSIEFGLPEKGRVSLKVYNAMGALVSVLVDETRDTGRYTVEFSGKDLPDGVYYARITVEGESREFVKAIPMVLLR